MARFTPATRAVLLLVLLGLASACQAKTYNVNWTFTPRVTVSGKAVGNSFTACVGDKLAFRWSTSFHGVWRIGTTCASSKPALKGPSSVGSLTTSLTAAGTFKFGCLVGSHCQGGMKISVRVIRCAGRRLQYAH